MVKRALKKAGAGIAQMVEMVRVKPRKERRLLLYFADKQGQIKILGEEKKPDEPSRFVIEKDQKVRLAVQSLMRQAMPCFHELDMILTRGNVERFVHNHIEYDLVRIGIYDVIGIPEGADPEDLLVRYGFTIIPLDEHPRKEKLISKIGRP